MPKKPTDPADQAPDHAADQAADQAAAAAPEPLPAQGGVFVRQPDGGLAAIDGPAATPKE